MTDKELLDFVERRIFQGMLEGCLMDDHLGTSHDIGVWSVFFRVDVIVRLLDMAKGKTMDEKVIMIRYDNLMQAIKEMRPATVAVKDKPASWWLDRFEEMVKKLKDKL